MNWATQALRAVAPRMKRIAEEGAESVRANIVGVMQRSVPSGHTDEEGYTSSAPGEPPAYGKGVYARSWQTRAPEMDGAQVRAAAFSDLRDERTGENVARGLEWGDDNNAPRPHVRVGRELARAEIEAAVRKMNP